jgi:hypothetical protein
MPRVALRLEYLTHIWFPCVDVTTHLRRPYRSLIVADSQQSFQGQRKKKRRAEAVTVRCLPRQLPRPHMSQTMKANISSAISAKEVHVYINILNEFQPSVFCNSVTRRAPNRQPRETSKRTLRNRALRVASPPKLIHASSIVPAAFVSLKFCLVMRARDARVPAGDLNWFVVLAQVS